MSFPFSVSPYVDPATGAFDAHPGPITSRQREIIALVVEGLTNVEIADRLAISHRTVQSHVASSMRRLQSASRTQLAVTALRIGLVPLHPEVAPDATSAEGRRLEAVA